MKISIVTISYNQAEFLDKCIASVIGQDYADLEYIVVDSGSTDGSREIIQKSKDKIDKIILEPDEGPADGLNKGFNIATGEIFGYVNADDVLLPGALSEIANFFVNHPVIDVVCGNGLQIDSAGQTIKKIFSTRWGLKLYAYGSANVIQQATFFRRKAFLLARGFNINNRTCWDGELIVDMALAGACIARTSVLLGGFRKYDGSISGSGRLNAQYFKDNKRIREKILGRSLRWHDNLLFLIYRFGKILAHPCQSFSKATSLVKQVSIGPKK